MKHNKTKLFSYWRARFVPEPYPIKFQKLLNFAFDDTKIRDRLRTTSELENYYHFVNYKADHKGFFCADFFGYEQGRIGQVIKESFEQEQIDPKAMPPPKADDGTDQQYLDGKLYFVCKDDHLIVAQDMHIKGRQLESYLSEMISKR
jgi:sulfatase maturation enzyme AslB (radical SAM superfamily)